LTLSIANTLRVVLQGPPASGKGTQGRRLADFFGLAYLSTGAVLREHVEQASPLGKLARPILDRGEYLPDDLMFSIIGDWLSKQSGGWVLDGFPRSLPQASYLDRWLADQNTKLDFVIELSAPYEQLLTRIRERVECLSCQWSGHAKQLVDSNFCPSCDADAGPRFDDSEENFRNRYREFTIFTEPVIDWYQKSDMLRCCDATGNEDDVTATILSLFHSWCEIRSIHPQ
jgi:adenylate kinase